MSMFKYLLSIPFYGLGLLLGFIIELIKELKSNGLLDDMKPMDFKEAMREAKASSKELFEEIKKETK